MTQNFSKTPWANIWTSPVETMRSILKENAKKGFIPLAIIATMSHFLAFCRFYFTEVNTTFFVTTILVLLLSPFIGMFFFYLNGWIFHFTGRWLKGKATRQEVTTCVAWGTLPHVILVIAYVFAILFMADSFFMYKAPGSVLFDLISLIAGIWSFLIFFTTLRDVQKFSIWRTIGNILLYMLIFGLVSSVAFAFIRL